MCEKLWALSVTGNDRRVRLKKKSTFDGSWISIEFKPTFVVQELGERFRLQTGSRRLEQWFCWEKAPQDSKNLASNVCDILEFRLSFCQWVILSLSCNDFCQWAVQFGHSESGSNEVRNSVTVLRGYVTKSRKGLPRWVTVVWRLTRDPRAEGRPGNFRFFLFRPILSRQGVEKWRPSFEMERKCALFLL